MEEEIVISNLKEVKEIFDKHNIRYWLDLGALLGAVRDGRIMEWDHDIDIATTDDNWEEVVATVPELLDKGFCVVLESYKVCNNLLRKAIYVEKKGCPLAIIIYQIKGEYALDAGFLPISRISRLFCAIYMVLITEGLPRTISWKIKLAHRLRPLIPFHLRKFLAVIARLIFIASGSMLFMWTIPRHYFEDLGSMGFYGMTFNIPNNLEEYLKFHYGKDWKSPKKEWTWWEDDGAVKVFKSSHSLCKSGYIK